MWCHFFLSCTPLTLQELSQPTVTEIKTPFFSASLCINNKLLLPWGLRRNTTDGAAQNNEKPTLLKTLKQWGPVTSFLILILIQFCYKSHSHDWSFFLQGLAFLKAREWLWCVYSVHSLFSLVKGFPSKSLFLQFNPTTSFPICQIDRKKINSSSSLVELSRCIKTVVVSSINLFNVKLRQKELK